MRSVPALLVGVQPGSNVVADRGYDYTAVLDAIAAAGAQPHVPTTRQKRMQRTVDPALYRQRNLIERVLQPPQALASPRHPLRQARTQLPQHRRYRRNPAMDTV